MTQLPYIAIEGVGKTNKLIKYMITNKFIK